jgi:hypothetical protein
MMRRLYALLAALSFVLVNYRNWLRIVGSFKMRFVFDSDAKHRHVRQSHHATFCLDDGSQKACGYTEWLLQRMDQSYIVFPVGEFDRCEMSAHRRDGSGPQICDHRVGYTKDLGRSIAVIVLEQYTAILIPSDHEA